ncbi:hypothetical protein Cgig2_017702 [Carnegiea gigantea]|uniref:DUF4283 domain-containing protein n=1 Tax=Carnegiea gigantea TaxID=171969 RepID=A0A9Q1GIJ1_9CARY|nr:hypothetical protein Cgig2_017702 [Carnegiea gigantea]
MVDPNEGTALEFILVSEINGTKCAKLVKEDTEGAVAYWQNAVICCVLGVDPRYEVIAGYVLLIKKGLYLVRFIEHQHALIVAQKGVYHFDQKPFIVKAWNLETEINIDVISLLLIWIQLPKLDVKYWGMQSLSKIGSMVGIPLKTDKYTKEKSMLKYARLLVEMPSVGQFLDYIEFTNEKSALIRQKVNYEWLPLKCSHCKMFGHTQENCRKHDTHKKEWRVRSQVQPQEQNQPSEEVEPSGDEDFQLVTKHTTRHYVARAEGQKEITTPNDLLQANTYNVRLEDDGNQAEGFLETKVKDQNIVEVMGKVFQNSQWEHNASMIDRGRIILSWHPRRYQFNMILKTDQLIHGKVIQLSANKMFYISFDLKALSQSLEDPWYALKDFNSVLHQGERIGGIEVTNRENASNIIDYKSLVMKVLFSLGQTIWSRIDRALHNELWYEGFAYTHVDYMTQGLSDHTPITMSFPHFLRPRNTFQFCDM